MTSTGKEEIREQVRRRYAAIVNKKEGSCCGGGGDFAEATADPQESARLGYTSADLAAAPEGANLGLGCGNPQAIAKIAPGESVLDLGSGGGFDCFLAARQAGEAGRVIGVDMTADMIARARQNAAKGGYANVEFRLGEIEHLPVADNSVDVIISNCVINLSPDKAQVFAEAFRVLRPGGRLAISDVLAVGDIPEALKNDPAAYCGCIAGAAGTAETERMLREAGFSDIAIDIRDESVDVIADWFRGTGVEAFVRSASIEAKKP